MVQPVPLEEALDFLDDHTLSRVLLGIIKRALSPTTWRKKYGRVRLLPGGASLLSRQAILRAWCVIVAAADKGVRWAQRNERSLLEAEGLTGTLSADLDRYFLELVWRGLNRIPAFVTDVTERTPMAPGVLAVCLAGMVPSAGTFWQDPSSREEAVKVWGLLVPVAACAVLARGRRPGDFLPAREAPSLDELVQVMKWSELSVFSQKLQVKFSPPATCVTFGVLAISPRTSARQMLSRLLHAGDCVLTWSVRRLKNRKEGAFKLEVSWETLPVRAVCAVQLVIRLWSLRLLLWPTQKWGPVFSSPVDSKSGIRVVAFTKRRLRAFFVRMQTHMFGQVFFTPRDCRNGMARAMRRLTFKKIIAPDNTLIHNIGFWKVNRKIMPVAYAGFDPFFVSSMVHQVIMGSLALLLEGVPAEVRFTILKLLCGEVPLYVSRLLTATFMLPKTFRPTEAERTPSSRRMRT